MERLIVTPGVRRDRRYTITPEHPQKSPFSRNRARSKIVVHTRKLRSQVIVRSPSLQCQSALADGRHESIREVLPRSIDALDARASADLEITGVTSGVCGPGQRSMIQVFSWHGVA